MKIMIFDEAQEHRGFNFKEGFAALLNSSGIPVAATSGRERKGNLLYVYRYVYRPAEDGRWRGGWESEETFPVQQVLDSLQDWQDQQELKAEKEALLERLAEIEEILNQAK